jgi:modulator of FtsH protease
MNQSNTAVRTVSGVPVSRVVRNAYILLAMVLATAAVGAGVGFASGLGWSMAMWVLTMVVFIGGPFAINAAKSGQAAIWMTFAWAGLVGFLLSPLVAAYASLPGGNLIVLNALGTTAVLFGALSAYAVTSRRDFSFMGGFLCAGLIVVVLAIVANLFLQMPMLSVTISAVAVMLMCGLILFETSRLVNDGQANATMIVVGLFSSITVLFLHLLNLFHFLSGDD